MKKWNLTDAIIAYGFPAEQPKPAARQHITDAAWESVTRSEPLNRDHSEDYFARHDLIVCTVEEWDAREAPQPANDGLCRQLAERDDEIAMLRAAAFQECKNHDAETDGLRDTIAELRGMLARSAQAVAGALCSQSVVGPDNRNAALLTIAGTDARFGRGSAS
jgi:hypothetical protein